MVVKGEGDERRDIRRGRRVSSKVPRVGRGAMGAGSGKGECRKEGVKEDGMCGGGPCWRPGEFTKKEVSWMGRFSSKMGGGRVWG